jgi:hypothetical protein
MARQGRLADRAGQQGGQGDADLHRRQEPVRVLGEPGGPLAAPAALHEGTDLALAQRDQGHLRRREKAANEHDEQDEHDVPADLVHVLIPDLRVSATGGPAPPSPKWDQAVAPARQMCAQSKQSAAGPSPGT